MPKNVDDDHVNAFGKGYTGGPLGHGDPDDRSLRHVEEHVFITQIIKDRAHHEKCHHLIKKWGECMEENNMGWKGLISFITCKQPLDKMNQCLSSCYKDKAFREECKEIYLDKRARYRATGIMDPDPYYKKPYYESEKKKEFLDKYRSEKKKKENESSMHEKESSST